MRAGRVQPQGGSHFACFSAYALPSAPYTTRPYGSFSFRSEIASVLNSERNTMKLELYIVLSTIWIQSFTHVTSREGLSSPRLNIKLTILQIAFQIPKSYSLLCFGWRFKYKLGTIQ
jgi:hypothetical protein